MLQRTLHAVERAAPDAASLSAARRLAAPGPWSGTGSTAALVWGRCQGSGATPYQVSVDLSAPAYRCSCPSRKFPCKHALALLMLWARGDDAVAGAAEPASFAREWAERRAGDTARQVDAAASPARAVDPAARARRVEERTALMTAGLEEFARWLADAVRGGLVQARRQPWGWWDAAAARLVDAQVPGLAERVRDLASEVNRRDDWADHLLDELGRWWTATRAWRAWADLDERTRGDLRAYLGWGQATDEVRQGTTVTDSWLVLGAHRSDDGRLQQQRTWLHGAASGQIVRLLDFAARAQPLPTAHLAGSVIEATVALYPGSPPRRALFATEPVLSRHDDVLPVGGSVAAAQEALAGGWADNPWAPRVPALLGPVSVLPSADRSHVHVVDATGRGVPALAPGLPWSALAATGGRETTVFAEVEAGGVRVLSVVGDDGLVAV